MTRDEAEKMIDEFLVSSISGHGNVERAKRAHAALIAALTAPAVNVAEAVAAERDRCLGDLEDSLVFALKGVQPPGSHIYFDEWKSRPGTYTIDGDFDVSYIASAIRARQGGGA